MTRNIAEGRLRIDEVLPNNPGNARFVDADRVQARSYLDALSYET